jgi:O-antigen/teichoic acid export membrane protein
LGALPIAAILLLAPDFVLGLFGQGFEGARASLFILTAASLLDIASGVALVALMMTHHQRAAIVAKGIGLTVNLVLCLTLIPALGASGAAIALAADTIATNALAVVLAWKVLGLNTTAFSLPRRVFGRV